MRADELDYYTQFLVALANTVISETVVLFFIVRRVFGIAKAKLPASQLVFCGICASGMTLPYLWFVLGHYIEDYLAFIALGEALVVVVETLFYTQVLKLDLKKSFVLSLLCNAVSYGLGLVLWWALL
jgi:hypothetical protein